MLAEGTRIVLVMNIPRKLVIVVTVIGAVSRLTRVVVAEVVMRASVGFINLVYFRDRNRMRTGMRQGEIFDLGRSVLRRGIIM